MLSATLAYFNVRGNADTSRAEPGGPGGATGGGQLSGEGQLGPAEMGGMSSLIKVREDLAAN